MQEHTQVKLDQNDELDFETDNSITKLLGPDEKILLSTVLYKYNNKLKRQERSILITTKAIYNVNKQGLLATLISIFNSNFQIRRRIDITKLSGISISDTSSEFVLHVDDEYDYRYASPDKRDKVLIAISQAYYHSVKTNVLNYYFLEDVNLVKYTTTKVDKKLGISRLPSDAAMALDEGLLKTKLEEANLKRENLVALTETVFIKGMDGPKVTLNDFDMLKVVGRGAFGKVMLVEKKDTKQIYAMKSIHKERIIDRNQIEHIKTERYVLEKSRSAFVVGLEFAFQTPEKIFFVMQFVRGGELFQHLRASRRFDEKRAKFYAAEIILALEYLHSCGVVYRDLKPENILMDEEGHLCLTDFGMAKGLKDGERTKSFVGTPEYLAPEIIEAKGHSKPVDWWSLGILIYEMLFGLPPFYNTSRNTEIMFAAITSKDVIFGLKHKVSDEAKDLITKLLTKKPQSRLGYRGAVEIKAHRWFSDIDWKNLAEKKITPPFKPKISGDYDVDNFDKEFTREEAYNSVIPDSNMDLLRKYQKEFENFTYVTPSNLLETKE